MASAAAGEACLEDLLEEGEFSSDDDENSTSSASGFVDDDATHFSTQTLASVEENSIDSHGERRPNDEEAACPETAHFENGYFGGVTGYDFVGSVYARQFGWDTKSTVEPAKESTNQHLPSSTS